jgi:hypothetical protein
LQGSENISLFFTNLEGPLAPTEVLLKEKKYRFTVQNMSGEEVEVERNLRNKENEAKSKTYCLAHCLF